MVNLADRDKEEVETVDTEKGAMMLEEQDRADKEEEELSSSPLEVSPSWTTPGSSATKR
jgi:hypothetical protein